MSNFYSQTRSPPPLQHPVPTHPAYIPEPPATPASPQGYQRFVSSPSNAQQPQQHAYGLNPPYAPAASQYTAGRAPPNVRGQPQQMHVPAPDFAAWGMNDATAQFGMQLGQSAVAAGQEYVQKNFGGMIPLTSLKHHFNVSNSYVMQKLRLVLFPWRHRPWTRKVRRSEAGVSEWQPPREDINSPDMYIPVMALVTYILLAALQTGLQSRFHPEVLGAAASKALAVVFVDFLFIKFGCYILNISGANQLVDLVAYGGYKFVGVIVTLVVGLLSSGRTVYTIAFVYAFLANAFFLLRSLRSVVLPDANNTGPNVGTVTHAQRSRRITFLFLVAMSQILYMGILVRV